MTDHATTAPTTGHDPRSVVEGFLAAMAAGDSAGALALVDPDILYVNVGLPPMRGAARVRKVLDLLDRPGCSFDVVTMWHSLEHVHRPLAATRTKCGIRSKPGMTLRLPSIRAIVQTSDC